jgi:tRNA modification GTPase
MVYGGKLKSDDNSMVTNVRHIDTLEKAHKSISDALDAVKQGLAYDFIEVDMKNCYDYLGEIIGETVEDDLIDKIFSNFCLGK